MLHETINKYYTECVEIIKNKNKDYGADNDDFKNFRLVERIGITSLEKGILVRMCDKMARLSNLIDKEASVRDEKITDTLNDLANYSMILRAYIEQKHDTK